MKFQSLQTILHAFTRYVYSSCSSTTSTSATATSSFTDEIDSLKLSFTHLVGKNNAEKEYTQICQTYGVEDVRNTISQKVKKQIIHDMRARDIVLRKEADQNTTKLHDSLMVLREKLERR